MPPAVDAGDGTVERPGPAAGARPADPHAAGAVAAWTHGPATGSGGGAAVDVRDLDRDRPEGHGARPGHHHDPAVGVGQGAGVGGHDVAAQGHPGRPQPLVQAGGDGGGHVPGAEQAGQAGRDHLHLPDLVAGGGRPHDG